ncbi:MAG TPA: hypothetical protein VGP25_16250 [Gemmatimonadaceae bacterium]|jgi:hypothetical protein|nr:hypothetical protein [Gemmatimonadaceae bacterium]
MRRSIAAVAALLALCVSCTKEEGPVQVRGAGLQLATLDVAQQAAVNAAAVRAAFDPDPSLSLLADPVYLPRTAGRDGGGSVAPALIARMKQQGVVRGTCQTPREGPKAVPVCPAAMPGYVVRFSEIFQLGKDSVEVYLGATRYRRAPKEPAEVLTFERAYQLVRSRGDWLVMREARLPNTQ